MDRLHRVSWALLLVATACGDDVTGSGTDGSTGGDSSSTGDTVDPTNVTVTVTDTTGSTTDETTTGETESSTSLDPDTGSTTSEDTDGTTTGSTTDASSSSDGSSSEGSSSESTSTGASAMCGDGMAEAPEACDGDDLAMETCASLGMGFTGGTLACDDACEFDTSACTSVAQPGMDEVIISEIMPNPSVVPDGDGEWFELHNLSDVDSYQLGGCEISGVEGEDVITIVDDLVIPPGGFLTFAPTSDADIGFTPDYEWDVNYFIGNGGDIITLSCGDTTVDTVDYDTFTVSESFSLNLDPDNYDAALNDVADSWCDATVSYNVGDTTDFGTPGAENSECAEPVVYAIDFCRLQFPTTVVEDPGTSVTVYGRLYVEGLTDMSVGNDLAPEVIGQVGYGPDGTDPAVDAGWTWTDATGNPGWDGSMSGEPNNDEYQADLTVPAAGEYDFVYRFSGDSGASYTYCDGMPAGSSDGYQVANAGQMTSNDVPGPDGLVLSEIYYDHIGADADFTWAKLYNGTDAAIDLSTYAIGWGGTSYTSGGVQLSGTIEPDTCFLLGGPDGDADSGWGMDTPAFDLVVPFDPQNAGATADGIALFDVTLDAVAADTVPIDAVIYGGANDNDLIDETGMVSPVDVGDAPNGDSIVRLPNGSWIIQADPTPTACTFAGG